MANRSRSVSVWLMLAGLSLLAYWLHRAEGAASVPDADRPQAALLAAAEPPDTGGPPVPAAPARSLRHATLGPGGTLDVALGRLGIEPGARLPLLRALDRHLDLKRLPPETGLIAVLDGRDHLVGLAVRAAADRFVRLSLDEVGEEPHAEVVPLPLDTLQETADGQVVTSVAQALSDLPHGTGLTHAFAGIFQWDIDLSIEPRSGDRIRLVYEIHRSGPVPDDLPRFGDSAARAGEFVRLGRILAASYEGGVAHSTAYLVEQSDGKGSYYDEQGRPLHKTFLKSPLDYRRISSRFSRTRRHPITRRVVPHHGVDFAAAAGTPVVASADGRVASTGWEGALGRAIRLRHGSEFVTVYGHLSRIAKGIRPGASVRQNQVIGYVGATGRATGPHLHYTLIRQGRPIDPMRFENPPAEALPPDLRPRLDAAMRTWAPLLGTARSRTASATAPRRAGRRPRQANRIQLRFRLDPAARATV